MAVLRHNDAFLLLKRNKEPNRGRYVPVGGKVDPHERPIDAVVREIHEETGLALHQSQLHFGGVLVESSPTDYNWQCYIYLADIPYQPPPDCDEGALEWIRFHDIPNIPTPPTDWLVYQYLMQGRPFAFDALYDAELELLEMREEIAGEVVFGGA
ncbi:MAG: NUDIX domain-containing protein [Phaeodactylibacter sp.]|nr:NUDIX domain-containing protein [Phaeodactylibacter sp.]MCB9273420.1 NUDIX domain-containing protein [Lewinellaceae bacterium]